MDIDMEFAINEISNIMTRSVNINSSTFSTINTDILYLHSDGLYTSQFVAANTIIGELTGKPTYVWDVKDTNYVIIDDDMVLDIGEYQSNIVNHVQEENCTINPSNSYVSMSLLKDGGSRFYLITNQNIMPFREIVYNAFCFVHTDMAE